MSESLGVGRLMILCTGPVAFFLRLGRIVEPKIVWSVGKFSKIPSGERLKLTGGILGGLRRHRHDSPSDVCLSAGTAGTSGSATVTLCATTDRFTSSLVGADIFNPRVQPQLSLQPKPPLNRKPTRQRDQNIDPTAPASAGAHECRSPAERSPRRHGRRLKRCTTSKANTPCSKCSG